MPTSQAETRTPLSTEHDGITNQVRGEPEALFVAVVVAVLVTADGRRYAAHWTPEFGDDEGWREMGEFIRDEHWALRPGERFERIASRIPLALLDPVRRQIVTPDEPLETV